jgi:vacuolar protein sorting-associated protein 16
LTQDGTYRLYSLSTGSAPPSYTQHSLGPDAQEAGVIEAKIYEEGLVALLGNLAFVEVKGWQKSSGEGGVGGKITLLASAGLNEPPSCWCVIPPELSHTRGVEVLIGSGATVLRLDEIDVQDQVGPSRPLSLSLSSLADPLL